jgi:hypothetical protein
MTARKSPFLRTLFRGLILLWLFSLGSVIYAGPGNPCTSANCFDDCLLSQFWCTAAGAGTTVNFKYQVAVCQPGATLLWCHKNTGGGNCGVPKQVMWQSLQNAGQLDCPFDLVVGSRATKCASNGNVEDSNTSPFNTSC